MDDIWIKNKIYELNAERKRIKAAFDTERKYLQKALNQLEVDEAEEEKS